METCISFFFYFDAKIPKFTYVKFEKRLTFGKGTLDPNMRITGHFKII